MKRTLTPAELQALLAERAPITLLDVRRSGARSEEPFTIPGATWYDPAQMEQWVDGLAGAGEIVLFCAHGESISNAVVDALHARHLKARFVEGGLEAWQAAGGAVEAVR